MAFATIGTGLELGGEVIDFGSDLFGGSADCNPSAVEGNPKVDKLLEIFRADPTAVERMRSSMLTIWPSHDCTPEIRAAGPRLVALYAVYTATGFTSRSQGQKAVRMEGILDQEIQQYEQSLGSSLWTDEPASEPGTTISPTGAGTTSPTSTRTVQEGPGLGPGLMTGALVLGALLLVALVWLVARG